MITTKSPTPTHIIQRNRSNALASTGPRTAEGKAIARQNALKHGLCANPAAGVVEDRDEFACLHDTLVERYQPRDPIEAGLVHRIAVCLWRLQRAARIDAATSNIAVNDLSPTRERVQHWMHQITENFWLVDYVEVRDKLVIREGIQNGRFQPGGPYHRLERRFLGYADKLRDEEMMKDGAALIAMSCMIRDFLRRLENSHFINQVEAQMLAWLLGESAERLVAREDSLDRRALYYPDERPWSSRIDDLIGEARQRAKDSALSEDFVGLVQARLAMIDSQARVANDPLTAEQVSDKRTAALLPNAATLDRLIRYETHADRSLHRALETLARLRGATVESVAARITGRDADGTTVELHGERTRWTPGTPPEPDSAKRSQTASPDAGTTN